MMWHRSCWAVEKWKECLEWQYTIKCSWQCGIFNERVILNLRCLCFYYYISIELYLQSYSLENDWEIQLNRDVVKINAKTMYIQNNSFIKDISNQNALQIFYYSFLANSIASNICQIFIIIFHSLLLFSTSYTKLEMTAVVIVKLSSWKDLISFDVGCYVPLNQVIKLI